MIIADKNFILTCYRYLTEMDDLKKEKLKEHIAQGIFKDIRQKFSLTTPIYIFCGNSFKGSLGLVLTKMMSKSYANIHAVLFANEDQYQSDIIQITLLKAQNLLYSYEEYAQQDLACNSLFIDAIEDSINAIPNEYQKRIKRINQKQAFIYSIDMPSGVGIEEPISPQTIKADFTHCLFFPKLAFFFSENHFCCGQWEIFSHNMAIPKELEEQLKPIKYYTTTHEDIARLQVSPNKFINKYSLGNGLLIAGSYGMGGAAVLAAKAAIRAGIGVLTLHIPKTLYNIIQISVPEARCRVDINSTICSSLNTHNLTKYTAIALGPGLGVHEWTIQAITCLLQNYNGKPIVFDADAINILAMHKELLKDFAGKAIFTPHEGEFIRLIGTYKNTYQRLQLQISFSQQYNAIVVCKGAFTSISLPDGRCYFNTNGNIGMATGGSGDVLTGIILALLCQGFSPEEAAICGVYMHAQAADIAVESQTKASLIASDIIENLKFVQRY